MYHNEPTPLSEALTIVETTLEYKKWMFDAPYIMFPASWRVQIIPPFGGAIVRFCVQDGRDQMISVFLDGYGKLCGTSNAKPYWEIHPGLDGELPSRFFDIHDTDKLICGIKTAFDQMTVIKRRESDEDICKKRNNKYFMFSPYRNAMRMRGVDELDIAALEITLCDPDDAEYWGWIPTDKPDVVTIASHKSIFDIHFPYGADVEQKRGYGKIHGLVLREVRTDI